MARTSTYFRATLPPILLGIYGLRMMSLLQFQCRTSMMKGFIKSHPILHPDKTVSTTGFSYELYL